MHRLVSCMFLRSRVITVHEAALVLASAMSGKSLEAEPPSLMAEA